MVALDEAGDGQFLEISAHPSGLANPSLTGDLLILLVSRYQNVEESPVRRAVVKEQIVEDMLEFPDQQSVGREAHPLDVVLARLRGIDFFKISRNAASDGEDVRFLEALTLPAGSRQNLRTH